MDATSGTSSNLQAKFVRVVITKDNMSAMMVLSNPKSHGAEITLGGIREEIERVGIVHGVNWEVIERTLDEKTWDTPVKIASGTPPQRGQDASFEYTLEPDQRHAPEECEDGRIDYRSINFIQNVKAGTVLAHKTPPTKGEDGMGVNGEVLPGIRGRDFPFAQGVNTRVSEDGLDLIAEKNGAIVFTRSGIAVNDLTTIKGDIDMSVGNIDCIGSVRVTGQVQAGFTLNVGGNLEVHGNVAESTIRCEGNVLVKGGCFGKGAGSIEAAGDVMVKYAEGYSLKAGNDVVVGDELLNCRVVGKERVTVRSRKGMIIGGQVNAGKEIRTAVAGTHAGTKTVLRVGYNEELMRRYKEVNAEIGRIDGDFQRVKQTLYELYKAQIDGGLDEQKAAVVKKLEEFQADAPLALEGLTRKQQELEQQLQEVADAAIIVEDTLYHGVVAHFGNMYRDVTESVKRCKLTLQDDRIIISDYRPNRP